MIIATTPRLTLRLLRPDDLPGLLAVVGDPEVMRFSDGVKDEAQTRAWLTRIIEEHYPRYGYGPYAVVERASTATRLRSRIAPQSRGGRRGSEGHVAALRALRLCGTCKPRCNPRIPWQKFAWSRDQRPATQDDTLIGYCGLFSLPELGDPPEVELGYRLARAAWGRGYATEAATAVRDYAFTALGLTRLVALIDPANTASLRVAAKLGMDFEREVMLPGYDHPDHLYAMQNAECRMQNAEGLRA